MHVVIETRFRKSAQEVPKSAYGIGVVMLLGGVGVLVWAVVGKQNEAAKEPAPEYLQLGAHKVGCTQGGGTFGPLTNTSAQPDSLIRRVHVCLLYTSRRG